jgi:hypothetical protein
VKRETHSIQRTLTWTRICCTWLRFSRNARTNNTSICRRWVGTRMNSLLGPCTTCHSTSPPVCPRRPSSVNWNCKITTNECIGNSSVGRINTVYILSNNNRNKISQTQVDICMSTTTLTDICKFTYPRALTKKKKPKEL